MKQIYLTSITLLILTFSQAQIVNIPDANFKNALINSGVDLNDDGEIQVSEAMARTLISVENQNISDLTGIESFVNLITLRVSGNPLTTIQLNSLTNLKTFNASNCQFNVLTLTNPNLEFLTLQLNQLTSLNLNGASSLKYLTVHNNLLVSLDLSSNTELIQLDIRHNQLSDMDVTNNLALIELIASNNQLTSFNSASGTVLEQLDLNNNLLTSINLDNLQSLFSLSIINNDLTAIEINNPALTNLDISGNQLVDFTLNDNNIMYFNCTYNLFSELDLSNLRSLDILSTVYLHSNPNLNYINLKNGINDVHANGNTIIAFTNLPNLQYVCLDSLESPLAFYVGFGSNATVTEYCSFVPGGDYYTISGNVTFDIDSNGCDASDIVYPNLILKITDGIDQGAFLSNTLGDYSMPLQAGNYTITPQIQHPEFFNVTPASLTVNFPTDTSPYTQDFCINANGVHKELDLTIIPLNAARPGFDTNYRIVYTNTGNTTIDFGQIILTNDYDLMTEVEFIPFWDSFTFVDEAWHFNYETLLPFESRTIDFTMNINTPSDTFPVNDGDVLTFNVNHFIEYDGVDSETNVALYQTVVNSFDPNDKTCLEGDTITPEMVGEYVHYLIRFENTGTADAINIVVKDVIDTAKFDISKLIPLHGSHDFVTRITRNNEVEFIFENINLPFDDANNDGYVAFKIKTLPTLALGDTFTNDAEIYFDYNAPIITNDFLTTVAEPLSVNEANSNSFKFYPNPVKDELFIESKFGIHSATIYDVNGRLLSSIAFTDHAFKQTIDVGKFSKGIYFMRIKSDDGEAIEKIIKK